MTMSCAVPILSLMICAVLLLPASMDITKISSRLPHQILLNTSLQVTNPPVRMDILSVSWEHNERPLVEYKDGNLTFHSPSAKMYMDQIMVGNISLVLTNLTLSDAGNYTCVVHYGGVLQTAVYALIIEFHRIRLLNLTPPPTEKTGVTLVRSTKKRPVLNVHGEASITANLGESVTLPCDFQVDGEIEVSRVTVHWSKDGKTKYFANKTCCDFPDGFEITEQDLKHGSAPLQLSNVQEKDAGVYTCAIKYETMEGSADTIFNIHGMKGRPVPQTFPVDDSIVPEAEPQYRTLKFGLVTGVVAVFGIVAVSLFICYKG
ncbi:uncharacterized protein LOC130284012 isoform X2 [Hyla sarda]|uniref:uncharacterized protein LOC130284012 isoform X2 n=1 Tax=Hyla sarda TaxID=327740 RepID=UPI0024C3CA2C|nr:uncharacterized protein LOC130284012 isoform X2 [Hyla sarda]